MKNTKMTALVMALLLAMPLFASCGETTETIETESAADTAAAETEAEDTSLKTELPAGLDFGGESVTIHARGDDDSFLEVYTEEQNGDVLNDAVYNRNAAVEELLNVDIIGFRGGGWMSYYDGNSDVPKIKASITAGDNAYQCIAGWNSRIASLAMEGYLLDLNDMSYLDLEKPWWNQTSREGLQLVGKNYFVTGDISFLTTLGGSYVLFLNNTVAENYGVTDLTSTVLEGNWTMDAMIAATSQVYDDLDGNGTMDNNDRYGFIIDYDNSGDSFYTSADIHQISVDEKGYPTFAPQQERVSNLWDKLSAYYFNGSLVGSLFQKDAGIQCDMFKNGLALMIQRELDNARTYFRDMEDSYTILPYPKLDEQQAQYYTNATTGVSIWCIPADNKNADTASAVMEAMAYETWANVTPAYFETCMQEKYARNEETVAMLDLIRNGVVVTREYIYSPYLGGSEKIIMKLSGSESLQIASWYASNTAAIEDTVASTVKLLEAIQ
ncbi:MAG: extracellular solute-binding protein [Clostridia bacterium]|nr:extracellular solute-binding protein [Clostridia bacterium]